MTGNYGSNTYSAKADMYCPNNDEDSLSEGDFAMSYQLLGCQNWSRLIWCLFLVIRPAVGSTPFPRTHPSR